MSERRVAVRGLEMAYREGGDGDPIVFLHGKDSPREIAEAVSAWMAVVSG